MANCTKRDISEGLSKFPEWFQRKQKPGFMFLDKDREPVMVIGEGGWRSTDSITLKAENSKTKESWTLGVHTLSTISMRPWTLVGAYFYKGEWHMCDLLDPENRWHEEITEMP